MIYEKLLDFQKQNIALKKDAENPVLKNKYSTLNEVLGKIRKPLNDLGILIVQQPEKEGLKTVLIDTEDNSQVECFFPYVEANTPQRLGSNNTYNRRYSLVTLLGLEDEDDDGNKASGIGNGKPKKIGDAKKMTKESIYEITIQRIKKTVDKMKLQEMKRKILADKKFFSEKQIDTLINLIDDIKLK